MKSTFKLTLTIFILFLSAVGIFGIIHTRADESNNGNDNAPAEASQKAKSGEADPAEAEDQILTVQSVKYFLSGNQAASLFTYNESAADQYAEALNKFKASIDPTIRVYSLLAPSAGEFADSEIAKRNSDSQKDAFAHINEKLNSEIVQVDAYDAIETHQDEYLYFRTDHHWTALGAYYAYSRFMESIGEEPQKLSAFKEGSIDGFLGSEYKALKNEALRAKPDTIAYYVPQTNYTYTAYSTKNEPLARTIVDAKYANDSIGLYAVFMGGDTPWGEIDTDNKNGRKLVVVKDSFANAFIPYLLAHYETIYYVDPRSYKGNLTEFVQEHQATEVLFLNNATVARNSAMAQSISGLL